MRRNSSIMLEAAVRLTPGLRHRSLENLAQIYSSDLILAFKIMPDCYMGKVLVLPLYALTSMSASRCDEDALYLPKDTRRRMRP